MNLKEYKIEHEHIYSTRLGVFGLGPVDNPTAAQHNMAVIEADEHVAALKREERSTLGNRLLDFRDAL
jgi:hypothetical protein